MSDVSVKFGAEDIGLEKTLKSVQAELGNLQDKVKSGDLSMTDLERSMKRVGQLESLEKRLQGMGTEAGQTSPKMDALGKDMKQMGDNAADAGDKGSLSFGKLAAASAAGGLAVAGFTKVLDLAMDGARLVAEKFGEALDMGGRLNDLKDRTGETAGNLLVLERAFDNAGSSAENVGPAINKLQKFMEAARDSSSAQGKAMDQLGISMDDLQGKTPTQQMQIFAEKISAIQDPTTRAAIAMTVFGKSGGELLPVLRNFSSEIENAKGELGSLPKIMDESSGKFDTISDKLQIVKGKFTEFAAGIIDRVLPALELFTVSFAKIDAAGLGQKLADAFIGGQQAMKGFTAALDAISIGDFSSAFKIAFMSIELQLKQTANEIWKNLQAAFQASASFLMDVLGPGSSIYSIIKNTFSILGDSLAISIGKALRDIMEPIPGIGKDIAANIDQSIKVLESQIRNSQNTIKNGMEDVGGEISRAAAGFSKDFTAAYNDASNLFDLKDEAAALAFEIDKIGQKKIISDQANDSVKRAGDEFLDLQNAINPLEAGFGTVEASADDAGDSVSELNRTIDILPSKKEVKVEAKIDKAQQFEKDVSDLLNIINGVPNSKIVGMAIDAGGFKGLDDLKKQVEFFPDSKQVKMVLEKLGINLDELKTAINGLPTEKRTEIAMKVFGTDDLEEVNKLLNALQPRNVEALCDVYGVENVNQLGNAIRGIPSPELMKVVAQVTGESDINSMIRALDTVSTKEKKFLLEMTGKESIDAIQSALAGVPDGKKLKQALEITGMTDVNQLKAALDMVEQKQLGAKTLKVDLDDAPVTDGLDAIEQKISYLKPAIKISTDASEVTTELSSIKSKIDSLGKDVTLTLNADASIQKIRNQLSQSLDVNFNNGGSGKGSMDINLTTDDSNLETLVDLIKGYVDEIRGKLPLHALGY